MLGHRGLQIVILLLRVGYYYFVTPHCRLFVELSYRHG